MKLPFIRQSKIAVVEIHGVIGDKLKINAYCELFRKIRKNPNYKAVIIDIKSPGGSAAGTEVLYHELQKINQSKPVVAYIREIGASGGYYLACSATHITALPTTIVGSIGVIFMNPVAEQLLSKIGIKYSVFKQGKYKDMGGFWRENTEEENEKFDALLKEVYDNFVGVVTASRSLTPEESKTISTGEIFTGTSAKQLKLIDQIGGFEDTLQVAAPLSGSKPRMKKLGPKTSLSDKFLFKNQTDINIALSAISSILTGGLYYIDSSFMLNRN